MSTTRGYLGSVPLPVAFRTVPLTLELVKEGTSIEAAGERVAGRQQCELLILLAHLLAGFFKAPKHFRQFHVLLLDARDVVKGGDDPPLCPIARHDGRRVDHEGPHARLVLQFQRSAFLDRSGLGYFQPRVVR